MQNTYVLMTKLGPATIRDPRGRRSAGREWMAKVKELCPEIHWRGHWSLLGPYDFLDIYEAFLDVADRVDAGVPKKSSQRRAKTMRSARPSRAPRAGR